MSSEEWRSATVEDVISRCAPGDWIDVMAETEEGWERVARPDEMTMEQLSAKLGSWPHIHVYYVAATAGATTETNEPPREAGAREKRGREEDDTESSDEQQDRHADMDKASKKAAETAVARLMAMAKEQDREIAERAAQAAAEARGGSLRPAGARAEDAPQPTATQGGDAEPPAQQIGQSQQHTGFSTARAQPLRSPAARGSAPQGKGSRNTTATVPLGKAGAKGGKGMKGMTRGDRAPGRPESRGKREVPTEKRSRAPDSREPMHRDFTTGRREAEHPRHGDQSRPAGKGDRRARSPPRHRDRDDDRANEPWPDAKPATTRAGGHRDTSTPPPADKRATATRAGAPTGAASNTLEWIKKAPSSKHAVYHWNAHAGEDASRRNTRQGARRVSVRRARKLHDMAGSDHW